MIGVCTIGVMESLLHFLHVLAACVLAGTTVFVGFCMIPVLRKTLDDQERLRFLTALGPRSRVLMWTSAAILLATGLYRVWPILGTPVWQMPYGTLLLMKIILALSVWALMAIHDFLLGRRMAQVGPQDPSYPSLRRWTIALAQIQLLLLLAVLWAAVRLRLYTW